MWLLRLRIILFLAVVFSVGIVARLFQVQIIDYAKISAVAKQQHTGGITIQSTRGEILSQDVNDDTLFKIATNTTLDLLYVDPSVTPDKNYTAHVLAPFILTLEDYQRCKEDKVYCPLNLSLEKLIVTDEETAEVKTDEQPITEDILDAITGEKTYEEALIEIETTVRNKISKDTVDYTVLKRNVDDQTLRKIFDLHFSGIFVDYENHLVFANPTLVPAEQRSAIARVLSINLEAPFKQINTKLQTRKIRYVPLKRKVQPDISVQIRELKKTAAQESKIDPSRPNLLRGVVLQPESWRYYPNDNLAAQSIGFHSQELGGQYGLEESYNRELQGQAGAIMAENDPFNRPITFGDHEIVNPINGESFITSIILPLQKKTEEVLEKAVKEYRADKGHVIIMDPVTGAILTLAHYPSFNPNEYSRVFEKKKYDSRTDFISPTLPAFIKEPDGTFRDITDEERENPRIDKYIYKNRIGPAAYRNDIVQGIYEPGSVFKPVTVAVALDRKLVSPSDETCDYEGRLEVDEFVIYNAEKTAHGCMTMTQVLEKSSNMGMAYVAKVLGKPLFYDYIKDFGFGEYTDVELPDEHPGQVVPWKKWSQAKLITSAFGQGISATPLQVATAWSALANGGLLMQPRLVVAKIDSNQQRVEIEPRVMRRVIGKETSAQITSMLVATIDNGVARPARLDQYYASGKTGTSQIARENGVGYEKGEGSFYTSFAGYLPVNKPRFVILVKIDRARIGENTYGSTTAAPVFKEVATYLAHYFNLPPDREGFIGAAF